MPRKVIRKSIPSGYDENGKCKLCRQMRTDEGHDPCIANLPGVLYACCGHGEEYGYIKFEDGRVLNFDPISVELTLPTHYIVKRPIPIRAPGEEVPSFNFETGRKRTRKTGHHIPILPDDEKVVQDAKKGSYIKRSEFRRRK